MWERALRRGARVCCAEESTPRCCHAMKQSKKKRGRATNSQRRLHAGERDNVDGGWGEMAAADEAQQKSFQSDKRHEGDMESRRRDTSHTLRFSHSQDHVTELSATKALELPGLTSPQRARGKLKEETRYFSPFFHKEFLRFFSPEPACPFVCLLLSSSWLRMNFPPSAESNYGAFTTTNLSQSGGE